MATSGGTATNLNYYEEHAQTSTLTGPWAGSIAITINFTKIGRIVTATSTAGSYSAAFTSASAISMSTAFPTRFRPSQILRPFCFTANGGTGADTPADIGTAGTMTFYGPGGGAFTASAILYTFSFTWSV